MVEMGRDQGMASSVASPAMWCNDLFTGLLFPSFWAWRELVVFLQGAAKLNNESSAHG